MSVCLTVCHQNPSKFCPPIIVTTNHCAYQPSCLQPSCLSTIIPINHRTYQPLCQSTIMPINHLAYQPLCLSTIMPINHCVYWPSYLSTIVPINHCAYQLSGLFLQLLSLSACYQSNCSLSPEWLYQCPLWAQAPPPCHSSDITLQNCDHSQRICHQ